MEEKWRAIEASRGEAVFRVEEKSIFAAGLIGEAIWKIMFAGAELPREVQLDSSCGLTSAKLLSLDQ